MSQRRQPTLERYLASLPIGIDSHPHCQSRASRMHSAIEGKDTKAIAAALPEPIAAIVREPPSPSMWIPAVWSDAVFHAVCDTSFQTEEAILEWCHEPSHPCGRRRLP